MIGKNLHWNGNFDNGPRCGTVIGEANGNLVIRWDGGSEMIVPAFVISAKHGWRVL